MTWSLSYLILQIDIEYAYVFNAMLKSMFGNILDSLNFSGKLRDWYRYTVNMVQFHFIDSNVRIEIKWWKIAHGWQISS